MVKFSYLLLIPSYDYTKNVARIIQTTVGASNKICYITLSKTHSIIREMLKDYDIQQNHHFFFIDAISSSIFKPEPAQDVVFLSLPLDLRKLDKAIRKAVLRERADALIFDSISSLFVFNPEGEILPYLFKLIAWLSEKRVTSIFLCQLGDESRLIVRQLGMAVDMFEEFRSGG